MKVIKKRFDELTVDELYSILKLRSEVFVVEQRILYVDLDEIDLTSTHYFITDDFGVFAYLRVIDLNVSYDGFYSIGRFCVRIDRRGFGIGKMLISNAIEDIQSKNIKIASQAYLKEMYEKVGFVAISEQYLLEGLIHIEMIYGK